MIMLVQVNKDTFVVGTVMEFIGRNEGIVVTAKGTFLCELLETTIRACKIVEDASSTFKLHPIALESLGLTDEEFILRTTIEVNDKSDELMAVTPEEVAMRKAMFSKLKPLTKPTSPTGIPYASEVVHFGKTVKVEVLDGNLYSYEAEGKKMQFSNVSQTDYLFGNADIIIPITIPSHDLYYVPVLTSNALAEGLIKVLS